MTASIEWTWPGSTRHDSPGLTSRSLRSLHGTDEAGPTADRKSRPSPDVTERRAGARPPRPGFSPRSSRSAPREPRAPTAFRSCAAPPRIPNYFPADSGGIELGRRPVQRRPAATACASAVPPQNRYLQLEQMYRESASTVPRSWRTDRDTRGRRRFARSWRHVPEIPERV